MSKNLGAHTECDSRRLSCVYEYLLLYFMNNNNLVNLLAVLICNLSAFYHTCYLSFCFND